MKDIWQYEEDETSDGFCHAVYNQDGTRITEPYLSEKSCRLIAAAPELLECLKDAYPYIDNDALRLRIGTAIAKTQKD